MSTVVLGAAALLAPRVLAKPSEVTDKKKFKEVGVDGDGMFCHSQ
jgi:hypothetical protein